MKHVLEYPEFITKLMLKICPHCPKAGILSLQSLRHKTYACFARSDAHCLKKWRVPLIRHVHVNASLRVSVRGKGMRSVSTN